MSGRPVVRRRPRRVCAGAVAAVVAGLFCVLSAAPVSAAPTARAGRIPTCAELARSVMDNGNLYVTKRRETRDLAAASMSPAISPQQRAAWRSAARRAFNAQVGAALRTLATYGAMPRPCPVQHRNLSQFVAGLPRTWETIPDDWR